MEKALKGFAVIVLALTVIMPATGIASETGTLEEQVKNLKELVIELDERLNSAEMHTATDKLSLGFELRTQASSIQYKDAVRAPESMTNMFFVPYNAGNPMLGGFNGATLSQINTMMAGMAAMGMVPAAEKYDSDNDIMFTTKFRMNMKGKVNNNLSFTGRLSAYKTWGDSAGVNFNNNGSMDNISLDGTSASKPGGDIIHLERAYMNYKNSIGSVPYNFSLGRRPSTDGPPLEYSDNNLEGGSPFGSVINWQFDGASLNFALEDATGIPGASFKLCYGMGFESDYGNQASNTGNGQLDDVHLMGFITSLFDNDVTGISFMWAYAPDLTDGFVGKTVMPFIVAEDPSTGAYSFTPNTGAFISRSQPTTNLGNWQAASLNLKTNVAESIGGIDLFCNLSWSQVDPNKKVSQMPMYKMLNQGLMTGSTEDGYSIWVGGVFPMPLDGKLGVEYNYGSKYWFNFTGAEDSMTGSKLAARGEVYEVYYHQPIVGDNFFITLDGMLYDYEYTGSGNHLAKPVKVSEANAMDAMFAQPDEVWNLSLSATMRF